MLDTDWPCKTEPEGDLPPRLLSFLYTLYRDHVPAGVIEDLLVQHTSAAEVTYFTNPHLEALARAHATFLLRGQEDRLDAVMTAWKEGHARGIRDVEEATGEKFEIDPVIEPDSGTELESKPRWVQPGASLTAPRSMIEDLLRPFEPPPMTQGLVGSLVTLLDEAKYDTIWINVSDSGVVRFTQAEVIQIAQSLGLEIPA